MPKSVYALQRIITNPGQPSYWRLDGEAVVAIPAPGGWLDRLRRRAGLPARADRHLHWQPVPPAVIDALANDGWLRTQLDSPRYPDPQDY